MCHFFFVTLHSNLCKENEWQKYNNSYIVVKPLAICNLTFDI